MKNRRIFFVRDGFRKTDLGIDLIANAFRGSIQNARLFSIVSFIYFLLFFEKQNGAHCCLPSKDSLIIHYLYSKDGFTYGLFSTKCFLFVYIYMYIDLFKLKAYKLFEDRDADLS